MKITVRAFADYREIIGREMELDLSGEKTIGELLNGLFDRYPKLRVEMLTPAGDLKEFINIFINGRNIAFLKNMQSPLSEGDIVALFPPVAGG